MRITFIWILLCLNWEILFTQASLNDNNITLVEKNFLVNLKINAFLDDHRLIRLNISWENYTDPIEHMLVTFIDEEGCSAIEDVYISPVKESSYLIRPSPDLTNPVDVLMNGCKYQISFETERLDQIFNQFTTYTIPDCVQDKCKCRKRTDSPHEIASVTSISDDHYFIRWLNKPKANLTIIDISYVRQNNSTSFTNVKEESITDAGIKVLLTDIKEEVPYTVIIRYSMDGCIYISYRNFTIPKKGNVQLIILIITLIIALIVIIIVILKYKYVKKLFSCTKAYKNEEVYSMIPMASSLKKEVVNPKYIPLEFLENAHKYDDYELPRHRIIKEKVLGEGEFGVVHEGRVFELGSKQGYTKVAIKELRDKSPKEEEQDLLNEMEIMKIIGHHEHIIGLLGCVTADRPLMMVLELADISLKNYLMQLRKRWSDRRSTFFFAEDNSFDPWQEQEKDGERTVSETLSPVSIASSCLPSSANTEMTTLNEYVSRIEAVLDHNELHRFAVQIARGMEYLEKINITHRDLAARNVLMMADGRVLKISDFGLSRNAIYCSSGKKKVPLRWWAIEALEQRTWSSKSDVWSFGIVLWEIGTLGAFPYNKTPDTLLLYDLKMGKRLERPKICTDRLYKLMLDCWSENPEKRPSFAEIVEHLDEKKKKIYEHFNVLNPKYDFPPADNKSLL